MDDASDMERRGKPVAEEKVGSTTVPIYYAPVTKTITVKEKDGATHQESKTYDSFMLSYYEGSRRVQPRRNTLEKAKKRAKEIATRLNKDGAQAEFIGEKDRRILILAKRSVAQLGVEVDEVCRRYAELKTRLKNGTPEQAVEFLNSYGGNLRLDGTTADAFEEYKKHIEKRGAGDYHTRDIDRYVGGFVNKNPGIFHKIETPVIDAHLANIGGKARNKNNHRDAIIGFFNFGQLKGFLPFNLPHAALTTTEFRDKRIAITSEEQAKALMAADDIYSPEEARKLLAVDSEPALMPSVEIKMLSGVRTEEIVRLWWVMVVEASKVIRVPDAVGKIDARQVPILDALVRRLAAIPEKIKHDRVAANWGSANSLYHAWQRLCRKAGVRYKHNGFRNSYFSYRLVIVGDIKKVAEEGGTSPEMLKQDYLSRAPISLAQAEEWFSL